MAKRPATAPDSLQELESLPDRLLDGLYANAVWIGVAVALLLLGTAVFAGYRSWSTSQRQAGSMAFETVRRDYLGEMGASPGAFEAPELASPEAAAAIREKYLAKFREMAAAHPGSVAAAQAWLEVGRLELEAGRIDPAIAALESGAAQLGPDSALRGTLLARIGYAHERAQRWEEAAQAHLGAADVPGFPLRSFALADAARCFDRAGRPRRALELLERADGEGSALPEHVRARLAELRALHAEP